VREFDRGDPTLCSTCRRLAPAADPSDEVLTATRLVRERLAARPKEWRVSRDASHLVIEMDLGWTRRLVVSARHGSDRPELVMSHSLLGSKRLPM